MTENKLGKPLSKHILQLDGLLYWQLRLQVCDQIDRQTEGQFWDCLEEHLYWQLRGPLLEQLRGQAKDDLNA